MLNSMGPTRCLFPIVWLCFQFDQIQSVSVNMERILLTDLLQNSSKYTRPSISPQIPTQVTLEFGLRKVESLDEKNQVLTTSGFIIAMWEDPFLTWDPEQYGRITNLIVPGDMIWLPEIALYNSAEKTTDIALDQADKFRVDIQSNGLVTWIPAGQWRTECKVNMKLFPFDTQKCNVTFINWTYKNALRYFMRNSGTIRMDSYSPNSEWILSSAISGTSDVRIADDNGLTLHLSTAMFTLELERSSGYYILNLIVPTMTLSVISVLMFWLPPECGERVSFGITIMLSFSVTMLVISDITPKSGSDMPVLMYYQVACMLINSLSLCVSVLIIHTSSSASYRQPSARMKSFVFGFLAPLLRFEPDVPVNVVNPASELHDGVTTEKIEITDLDQNDDVLEKAMAKETKHEELSRRVLSKLESKLGEDREADSNKEEWLRICRILDYALFIFVSCGLSLFTAGFGIYISILN